LIDWLVGLITHADDSRGSKAFSRVSMHYSVCSHDKTKTAETEITKLCTGIVCHESSLRQLIGPIRSKG